MMNYTSIADLANTIRLNAYKVPSDVRLIVGVPRSGMMAALMLGEILHKPVIDLYGFLRSQTPFVGSRGKHMRVDGRKVLVLDDTVYSGRSFARVRTEIGMRDNVIYGCVYAEGKDATQMVDVFFENNYDKNEELWHLYEWNILHHGEKLSSRTMFDLDGVLCADPPDERDTDAYEAYIENATPMVLPTTPIGAIVTFRKEKYRAITEAWLNRYGIEYGALYMATDDYWRNEQEAAAYKHYRYAASKWAKLFIESSAKQAEIIAKTTGKPVWCYANGKMYR